MNPDELEKLKQKILQIKNTRLITDPFPAHTEYNGLIKMKLGPGLEIPPKISIWGAYRKGYEQAYKEILENLK